MKLQEQMRLLVREQDEKDMILQGLRKDALQAMEVRDAALLRADLLSSMSTEYRDGAQVRGSRMLMRRSVAHVVRDGHFGQICNADCT